MRAGIQRKPELNVEIQAITSFYKEPGRKLKVECGFRRKVIQKKDNCRPAVRRYARGGGKPPEAG